MSEHTSGASPVIFCNGLDLQASDCSFVGRIASDPESTVYISGCPEKESMDISLMSKKVYETIILLLFVDVVLFDIIVDLVLVLIITLIPIPHPNDLDEIMIRFQSKLQFNTYRLEKAGKT